MFVTRQVKDVKGRRNIIINILNTLFCPIKTLTCLVVVTLFDRKYRMRLFVIFKHRDKTGKNPIFSFQFKFFLKVHPKNGRGQQ